MRLNDPTYYIDIIIKNHPFMLGQSRNQFGQNYKRILVNRRKKTYDNRSMLPVSILSLFPEKAVKESRTKHNLKDKICKKRHTDKVMETVHYLSQRKAAINCLAINKKSSQKQKNIFNRLKISNFSGIRRISHILFKPEIDQMVSSIQQRSHLQNHFLPLSQGKVRISDRSPFKLSDTCKFSHLNINAENDKQYQHWRTNTQTSKSRNIRRSKAKSVQLRSTIQQPFYKLRTIEQKVDMVQGWQSSITKRFQQYDEDFGFDIL